MGPILSFTGGSASERLSVAGACGRKPAMHAYYHSGDAATVINHTKWLAPRDAGMSALHRPALGGGWSGGLHQRRVELRPVEQPGLCIDVRHHRGGIERCGTQSVLGLALVSEAIGECGGEGIARARGSRDGGLDGRAISDRATVDEKGAGSPIRDGDMAEPDRHQGGCKRAQAELISTAGQSAVRQRGADLLGSGPNGGPLSPNRETSSGTSASASLRLTTRRSTRPR